MISDFPHMSNDIQKKYRNTNYYTTFTYHDSDVTSVCSEEKIIDLCVNNKYLSIIYHIKTIIKNYKTIYTFRTIFDLMVEKEKYVNLKITK